MSAPRMTHLDRAILLARFFAHLRHGLAYHYGIHMSLVASVVLSMLIIDILDH
jgi:hypothetical protein